MLALRGTPRDAKGRLATPVPTRGGLPPPTAATASATRGSDAASAGMGADAGGAAADSEKLVEQRAPRISQWQVGQKTYRRKVSKM
eukprot:941093-Amphidinium_carterae.1